MTVLEHLPIVYIDEAGIDTYLYRKNARAPRGEKVYESVSGRRFKRTSIVSGQVNHRFIAPMIYQGSMTSAFFVEWFKTQLLPSLEVPHVIVMDNASFHPKKILDELSICNGHFFLPLPPYSPELNPIENSWAILKKAVTELLRKTGDLTDAITYYLESFPLLILFENNVRILTPHHQFHKNDILT